MQYLIFSLFFGAYSTFFLSSSLSFKRRGRAGIIRHLTLSSYLFIVEGLTVLAEAALDG
jgi:hypothetical protein